MTPLDDLAQLQARSDFFIVIVGFALLYLVAAGLLIVGIAYALWKMFGWLLDVIPFT